MCGIISPSQKKRKGIIFEFMNYEEFYAEYAAKEKELRDYINSQQKYFKRIAKDMENGDLKNASKNMDTLREISEASRQTGEALQELARGFDMNAYIAGGEFAEHMLAYFEKAGIDAKGENNAYEVFPYKLRLDAESAEVVVNRKKVPYLRPQSLVKHIKTGLDKLMEATFNPADFAAELARAYDLSLIVQAAEKKRMVAPDGDVYLVDLYKYLTPMKRFRRDYDVQGFTFDIARLHNSDINSIEDGRNFDFGPSRNNDKSLRILDKHSMERHIAIVRFYKAKND